MIERSRSQEGPYLSLLTSPARGAIAVLRVWGQGAVRAADEVFRPHRGGRLSESPSRRPRVGRGGGVFVGPLWGGGGGGGGGGGDRR
jgi:hypothetical protein